MNINRVVGRINPLLATLPDWVEKWRAHQVEAVYSILEAFERVNVVILEAPTGTGKTLVAETVRRLMETRGLYVCNKKELQDQFCRDFPYSELLKGRNNYPTEKYPKRFRIGQWDHLSCEDCTYSVTSPCNWCMSKGSCPYEITKARAMRAELAVINTSYFLSEANHAGRLSKSGRLVICDEADTLEKQLMDYVSVEISERRMREYGWKPPRKVTVQDSWKEWLDEIIPQVTSLRTSLPISTDDLRIIREKSYLTNLQLRLAAVSKGLGTEDWVYTGDKDKRVSFKPSRVDSIGQETLWKHGDKWLLMSATIISAGELVESLGYKGNWDIVTVPSVFSKESRKVIVKPIADMSRKADERANLIREIKGILTRHPTERVLLHSVSYDLTTAIMGEIRDENRGVFSYNRASDRERAFTEWQESTRGILVAPSLDRGTDLPGDKCRVQVICKVPFPFLGDRQISARLHSKGGEVWYRVQTIRTIVQMCGRVVRSEDDWGVTYILDKQFNNLWNRARMLFPKWWLESVVWER